MSLVVPLLLQTDRPITPQNKADIALNKTVSPAFEGNNQNSNTLLVGSEFTFRVRVEVQGERTNFAEKVVMTDNLPPGLQFVSLSEQPSDRGVWWRLLIMIFVGALGSSARLLRQYRT
jgi:uncharacterized repeat protein (TIGR01451 family)